jgi:hypothetical protein
MPIQWNRPPLQGEGNFNCKIVPGERCEGQKIRMPVLRRGHKPRRTIWSCPFQGNGRDPGFSLSLHLEGGGSCFDV